MQSKEGKLRRFALQIVQQLPETKADALLVLDYARELVMWAETPEGREAMLESVKLVASS